ncbi:MAG: glutathionylspermidine synthase family protein [Defluviitaleaceae bacterium]|nr:glutathionylspermidine synthase family protein [Defluviitaleaceae bacterium]
MKIKSIPEEHYPQYRMNVMFDGYKWDLQAGEQSTISDKVLLFEPNEISSLIKDAVALYNETIAMECALQKNPGLVLETGISQEMTYALCNCKPKAHIRFMRFDFHPTTDGWRISEVNSDVPAGYPEASILPELAQVYFPGYGKCGCFGEVFAKKVSQIFPKSCIIAYLHDTHTVEDYQILHYLGDLLETFGYNSMYASPENIKWQNNKALDIGGIIRYFPVEWMEFTKGVDWLSFVNSETPSCNHPIALLTQSKRLPLVWDRLGVDVATWKKLLPETKCASTLTDHNGWILKPAFGRVGEGINIPGTMSSQEENEIRKAAHENPTQWVAQKMFESVPLDGLHVNVGMFVTDGEFSGCYARVSSSPKIDEDASEIPILVRGA